MLCDDSIAGPTDPPRHCIEALAAGRLDGITAWSGQSAALARAMPAGDYARAIWSEAQALLP